VRAARSRLIDPNRVVRYAFLHTRRAKRKLAGEIHELETGDRDDCRLSRIAKWMFLSVQ
jgi:hypothetical protein